MQFEGYIPGAYLVDCDRCGMTYYSFQTCIEDYTGLRVCRGCLDKTPTYPTPPPDKISVPNPRPEQEVYVGDNDDSLETNIDNMWLYANGYPSEYTSSTIMTAFDATLWP